jgi:hypothetical protein
MSLVVNGTTIPTNKPFHVNGHEVKRVVANGVEVWKLNAGHWSSEDYGPDNRFYKHTDGEWYLVWKGLEDYCNVGNNDSLVQTDKEIITNGTRYKVGLKIHLHSGGYEYGIMKWIT